MVSNSVSDPPVKRRRETSYSTMRKLVELEETERKQYEEYMRQKIYYNKELTRIAEEQLEEMKKISNIIVQVSEKVISILDAYYHSGASK